MRHFTPFAILLVLLACDAPRTDATHLTSEPAVSQEYAPMPAPPVAAGAAPAAAPRLTYPPAPQGDVVDDYHGTRVPDPWRWLEDPDSPATRAWIDAQNAVTQGHLAGVARRDAIRARLTEAWNFERFGLPSRRGGRYLMSRNDGLQNQSVLYVAEAVDATPRLLLDPNTLAADGAVALAGASLSRDGRLLAYGVAEGGSDWVVWKVRDVATGADLPDRVDWVKFAGASWTADGAGFFYSRYDAPKPGEKLTGSNRFHKIHYHRIGTPQSEDVLVHERADDGELNLSGRVTDDGKWLVISVRKGTQRKNVVQIAEITGNPAAAKPVVRDLIAGFDAQYAFVGNVGRTFWFRTDRDAPRGRLVAVDLDDGAPGSWKTVVAESADTLVGANHVGGRLVLEYLRDAHSVVRVHTQDGALVRQVGLPGLGTAAGFEGDPDNPETFYTFTSFTDPGTIFRYDVATGESTVFRRAGLAIDTTAFETTQVRYTSRDGTAVPMFLTRRKDVARDGNAPVLLYGYGGFNIPLTPSFSVANLVWMEMGGVYAVANLRGGGEFGEAWHAAGRRHQKQNVFDDFIGAAEWLIQSGWTRPSRLAAFGGSNGGLLVAATMLQRPDLFGACMPAVGVLDMLRFHKFTIGWAWVPEYGSPDDPEDFATLRRYSPYHNLERRAYPATLITTADHDDRVVPAHSFKFAAALQHHQTGDAPVLIRIETRAGHGAGKPTSKQIEEAADRLAFLVATLDVRP